MEDLQPKMAELQIPHYCCNCGYQLHPGVRVHRLVVSIRLAPHRMMTTTQAIVWCADCWGAK